MSKISYIIVCFLMLIISNTVSSQNIKDDEKSIPSIPKKITWSDGYNLGKSGILKGNSGEVSNYIPVNKEEIIIYRLLTRGNWCAIAFYDKDTVFLKGKNESEWENDRPFTDTDYNTGVESIPEEAAFVRFCRYKPTYKGRNILPYYLEAQYVRFYSAEYGGLLEKEQDKVIRSNSKSQILELSELMPENPGIMNMVRNAYQMTRIEWTPIFDVDNNKGKFKAGQRVEGIPYSSTKEIFTYVPQYVSFETFMTSIRNPKSDFYLIHLDESPYNGSNCRSFYGAVCSTLTSYACGLQYVLNSDQYKNTKDLFRIVDDGYNIDSINVGDLLQSDTKEHVMIVTRIWTDQDGQRQRFEITEENGVSAVSGIWEREYIKSWLESKTYLILRYKLSSLVKYTPYTDFVTLEGEKQTKYRYNKYICPNRGNKALYLEKDSVVINILSDIPVKLVIFKNGKRYRTIKHANGNVYLNGLTYGTYKVRAVPGFFKAREHSLFKVVNIDTYLDKEKQRIYFSSENAIPSLITFCYKGGVNATPTGVQNNFISEEELIQGFKDFGFDFNGNPNLYYRIHCWDREDGFGKIITRNISLKDSSESPY